MCLLLAAELDTRLLLPHTLHRSGNMMKVFSDDLKNGRFDLHGRIYRLPTAALGFDRTVVTAIDGTMVSTIAALLCAVTADQLVTAVRTIQESRQQRCAIDACFGLGIFRQSLILAFLCEWYLRGIRALNAYFANSKSSSDMIRRASLGADTVSFMCIRPV